MKLLNIGSSARVAVALLVTAACGDSSVCLSVPCPFSYAVGLTVASAVTSGAVNATVNVAGAKTDTTACNGTCFIFGDAGTYRLTVSAPGYVTAQRTVVVLGTHAKCSCFTVQSQDVSISLTPST